MGVGSHIIKIVNYGYKDDIINVTVKGGEIKNVRGHLTKTKTQKMAERYDYPNEGIRCLLETGIGGGIGNYSYSLIEAKAIVGYQIKPSIFVGYGLGIHCYSDVTFDVGYYSNSIGNFKTIPLFIYARYDMINYRISPFLDGHLGIIKGDLEGKCYAFAFGVRFNSVNLTLGLDFEQHDGYYEWKEGDDQDFLSINFRVSLDIGARKR